MSAYINPDFMLTTEAAKELYHTSAEMLPIVDYHCHLNPREIATNHQFLDITEAWLGGDHYKWRALRANGVPEEYITGGRSSWEKFEKWAETVPYTMRNPLYHWTHLELKRVFGINKVFNPKTAREIYEECNAKLAADDFRAQAIMRNCGVEVVCTTDDPADSLEYHKQIIDRPFGVKVLPTWRADKAMAVEDTVAYVAYLQRLGKSANINIECYDHLIEALRKRQDFFHSMGCRLSDHGLDTFYAEDYTEEDIKTVFAKLLSGKELSIEERAKFKSALLEELAVMDAEKGWTQQFHIGVIRNNNSKMFAKLGADAGYDSILDLPCAVAGNRFFDRLEKRDRLAKTILYNLNPKDNEVLATMAYNFNDGSVAGKMQFGAAWWFLDQEDGMRKQLNTLSALGLLSRFVGMLTDSRSFLSYPRHDYFRRILCDVIGRDVEDGKLPRSEMDFIKSMVSGISYYNAKKYFNF